MPLYPGPGAITGDTEFDTAVLRPVQPHGIDAVHIYEGATLVGYVRAHQPAEFHPSRVLALDDPEFLVVMNRWKAGECAIRYGGNLASSVGHDEIAHLLWEALIENPFEPMYGFFEHLAHYGSFEAATDRSPRRFVFPGIVEGAQRTYYKRTDSPSPPDVRDVADLAGAGWTPDIPFGPHALYAVEALDAPGSVSVSAPRRVYHRRKDQNDDIVQIARKWRNYWRSLTNTQQGISARITARKHFEHAIGRAWADRPNSRAIDVFYAGRSGATERSARDAEDWMIGNLEQWAHVWGFDTFAQAISGGGRRGVLDVELGDYTFCHVNEDGSVGDRLSNGADGLTEATWDAYQDTHYPAAIRHGVGVMAMTIPDGDFSIMQGETMTIQPVLTGGLGPFTYELTQGEDWSTIDTETGLITIAPSATEPASSAVLTVTATDDLGSTVSAQFRVTITVLTAITVDAGPDHTVASSGTVAVTATATVTDAVGPTTYEWVLIGGAGSTLEPQNTLTPTFTAPPLNVGDPDFRVTWELRVSNNGIVKTDRVTFTVTAPE